MIFNINLRKLPSQYGEVSVMAKTNALISCAVTAQLICAFIFAYGKSRFSHDAAHIMIQVNLHNDSSKAVSLTLVQDIGACTGTSWKADYASNDFSVFTMLTCPCIVLGFTGVYSFLNFALKHRLWVLVRTVYQNLGFEQK